MAKQNNNQHSEEIPKKVAIEKLIDLWYKDSRIELEISRRLLVFSNIKSTKTNVRKLLGKLIDKNITLSEVNKLYELTGGFGNENIDYPYQFPLSRNYIEAIDNLAMLYGRGKK